MKVRIGSLKKARNEQVFAHHVKFSKTSLGLLCTAREGLYSCAPIYCGFSTQGQMAPQQTANFRTAFLVIFLRACVGCGRVKLYIDLHAIGNTLCINQFFNKITKKQYINKIIEHKNTTR